MKRCMERCKVVNVLAWFLFVFFVFFVFAAMPIVSYSAGPDDICLIVDKNPKVVIDGCDTGVSNVKDQAGCTISQRIMQCAGQAKNHGEFVSCVSGDGLLGT